MALNIQKTERWVLIEKHYLFNPTEIEIWIINLISIIGEAMAYDRWSLLSIDFPGEYDIAWNIIKVFLWKWDKLNFLVFHDKINFWIIQSPEVLEMDEVCDMQSWIFSDESVEKKLDQLEMEWNRINLNNLEFVGFDEALQRAVVNENNDDVNEMKEKWESEGVSENEETFEETNE